MASVPLNYFFFLFRGGFIQSVIVSRKYMRPNSGVDSRRFFAGLAAADFFLTVIVDGALLRNFLPFDNLSSQ
jgi:hypothetical protein